MTIFVICWHSNGTLVSIEMRHSLMVILIAMFMIMMMTTMMMMIMMTTTTWPFWKRGNLIAHPPSRQSRSNYLFTVNFPLNISQRLLALEAFKKAITSGRHLAIYLSICPSIWHDSQPPQMLSCANHVYYLIRQDEGKSHVKNIFLIHQFWI